MAPAMHRRDCGCSVCTFPDRRHDARRVSSVHPPQGPDPTPNPMLVARRRRDELNRLRKGPTWE